MKYHGFNCQVIRGKDGDAYTEFGVQEDRANRIVTCWIAVEAGSDFSLQWRDERRNNELGGFDGSRGTVIIDGSIMGKREATDDFLQKFWGVSVGDGLKQPLIFANAGESVTTDEFEARADEGRLSGLGTIEVAIQRGIAQEGGFERKQRDKYANGTPSAVLRSGPRYLEEAKQSCDISHTVSFGKPVAVGNFSRGGFNNNGPPRQRVGYVENENYVTFRFKYRSRQFLKAQGHLIDDGASTIRNTQKPASVAAWDQKSSTWKGNLDNIDVIEIDSDDDDSDGGMDVDSRYDSRARSRTRFSTEPPSDDPMQLEREREQLRAKLEI